MELSVILIKFENNCSFKFLPYNVAIKGPKFLYAEILTHLLGSLRKFNNIYVSCSILTLFSLISEISTKISTHDFLIPHIYS